MSIKAKKWIKISFIFIILILLFFTYSRYIETKLFKINEHIIVSSKIPKSFYGVKVVHISDIHYKVTTSYKDLKKIINKINLIKPDIVIFTGDLFDKSITYTNKDYKNLTKLLSSIDSSISKYAISGDNDLNNKNFDNIIIESGFINLDDSYDTIYNNSLEPITITGISSNYKNVHINKTLNTINKQIDKNNNYSILVLHEPDLVDEIDYSKYNLILAGHSLGGSIKLPFIGGIVKDKLAHTYYDSYYKLNNTKLYVSNGIGTNKLKLRFLNTPSVNLYRLKNES